MPIYEYQCQACNKQMEVLRKISDAPLVRCPECGKDTLRKKVSAAAFRLKGGGWYETDFKTSGQKNLASGSDDKAPASSGDKAVTPKADTSTTDKSKNTA
jgi:putative FmdB family regulatory protein